MFMEKRRRPKEELNIFKFMLLVFNAIFVILALGSIGVGVWLVADRIFISNVVGVHFFTVAAYMVLISGGIALIVSLIGLLGAVTNNKVFVLVYVGLLVFIFVALLLAGILAIVFKAELGEHSKQKMHDSLMQEYGVDMQNQWNRDVTWAWDQAQERLQCCGVSFGDLPGYTQYKDSRWFGNLPDLDQKIRPMVPKSCCKRDPLTHEIIGRTHCQTNQFGPPHTIGGDNSALHIKGCYERSLWYISDHTAVIIGVGIGTAILLIGGIVLAILFYRTIKS